MAQDAPDTFDIAGQEEAAKRAREKQKLRDKLEIEALQFVMQNKRGRRFVYGILARAGVFRSSFDTNALTMARNEGRRLEGLVLTEQITEHCFDLYMQMLKEHTEDE